jgi:hypothetical protein
METELLHDFSDANLTTDGGRIFGFVLSEDGRWRLRPSGDFEIEIKLRPFKLEGSAVDPQEEPPMVSTSISLTKIRQKVTTLNELAGKTYRFPTNPEPGYIDGSVYVSGAHNPVDVSELRFGKMLSDSEIEVVVVAHILFELEHSGYRDRDATVTANVRAVARR